MLFSGLENVVFRTGKCCFQDWKMLFSGLENVVFWTGKCCFLDWKMLFSGLENVVFWTEKCCFLDCHRNFNWFSDSQQYLFNLYLSSYGEVKVLIVFFCLFRNWVFATNPNFLIPILLQPDGVNLWYFKLRFFELYSLKYL